MRFQTKLLITFILLAGLIAGTSTYVFHTGYEVVLKNELGRRLQAITNTGALMIDGDEHIQLKTRQDERTPLYRKIKAQLQNIRDANSKIRYVYTMIRDGNKARFVVDGEEDPKLVSHIGDEYNLEQEMLSTFKGKPTVNLNFVTDQWGTWVSGYAPIQNSKGDVVALLGIDMSAESVIKEQRAVTVQALKLFAVLLVMGLMVSAFLARRMVKPIQQLVAGTQFVSQGDFTHRVEVFSDGELAELATRFNLMVESLQKYVERLTRKIGELSTVSEINKAISSSPLELAPAVGEISFDAKQLPDMVLGKAIQIMNAESGSLMLIDEDELRIIASRGLDEDLIRGARLKVGQGISGWVAKEGKPLLLKNGIEDSRFQGVKPGLKDALSVPLRVKGRVIGVLNVNGRIGEDTFSEDDLNLLTTLADQAAIAIEMGQLIETLQKTYLDTITALVSAIDAKDHYTGGHSERVSQLARETGRALGMSEEELQSLEFAARFHDIGKIGIGDQILQKPGALSVEERAIIETHADIGANIISQISFLEKSVPFIGHHHERYDGKGYPDHLQGEDIPLGARILAVVDAYEAMASDRPYRKALSGEQIITELKRCVGTQFDPKVVEAFLFILEKKSTQPQDKKTDE